MDSPSCEYGDGQCRLPPTERLTIRDHSQNQNRTADRRYCEAHAEIRALELERDPDRTLDERTTTPIPIMTGREAERPGDSGASRSDVRP